MDEKILACSNHQSRWLLIHQTYDLSRFNLHFFVKLEGKLDEERFVRVANQLFTAYDFTHTSFQVNDGVPQRVIHASKPFNLEQLQFDSLRALEAFTMEKALQSFDFSEPPLFYSALAKVNGNAYWILVMHHLISDVSSGLILTQQMYHAYLKEPTYPIYDYNDYVAMEEKRFLMQGDKSTRYILEHVRDHRPLSFSHQPLDARKSETLVITFGETVAQKLHHFSEKHHLSYHTLFSTPLFLTHYQMTMESQSFMAIPVSERRNAALKQTPGFISGPMLIGLEMSPKDTIKEILAKAQKYFFQGLKHYLPIGRYQHLLEQHYRIMFNVFDYRAWTQEHSDFMMNQQLLIAPNTMQMELFWVVFAYRDKIEMVIHYDEGCLGNAEMHDIVKGYRQYFHHLLDEEKWPLPLGALHVD